MTTQAKGTIALVGTAVVAGAVLLWYFTVIYHTAGIKAPVAGLDVPYLETGFRAEEGLTLHYETGSVISIPPNALVDADGNRISGKVTAKYREFQSATDIFRAGVPMGSVGEGTALMSGGMFELWVQQGDEVVYLADGLKVGVSLAAYRPTDTYDIYELNDGQWAKGGKASIDSNLAKKEGLANLPPMPIRPVDPRVAEDDIIIELDANYYNNPELSSIGKLQWKLVPEENPGFADRYWAFRIAWDKMKLVKHDADRNLFKLEMKSNKKDYQGKPLAKEYSVIVTPVLYGADLEASLADFKKAMAGYDSVSIYLAQEQERLQKQADVLNTFNIESFGVHNIDKLITEGLMVGIPASFNFTEQINPYFTKVRVYFLNHDLNTVQNYGITEWHNIYMQRGSNTTVVAVLPNEQVAIVEAHQFAKLPLEQGQPFRFQMKVVPQAQLMPVLEAVAAR